MKKSLTVLTALGLLGTSLPVQAGIEEDIAAFQDYFKKRFSCRLFGGLRGWSQCTAPVCSPAGQLGVADGVPPP